MAPEQRIRPDKQFQIGENIRIIRLRHKIRQSEMVGLLQLKNIPITRETYVKIERGIRSLRVSELKALKEILETTYEELLEGPEKELPEQ